MKTFKSLFLQANNQFFFYPIIFNMLWLTACDNKAGSFVTPVNGQDKNISVGENSQNAEIVKAIKNKDAKKVKELLDNKVNPNSKDENGNTLLNLAISVEDNKEICEILLTAGADPNLDHPIKTAFDKNKKDIFDLLIAYGADASMFETKRSPLYQAISECSYKPDSENARKSFAATRKIVEKLLNEGVDVNQPDGFENNSLFFVSDLSLDIAEKLIAKGADINHPNKNGWTPLFNAVRGNNIKITKLLIAKGANVNVKDKDNWSVLQQALVNGCSTIVIDLEKAGAKLE